MRLNREFRTKTFVFRFHLLWVLFYLLVICIIGLFVHHVLEEHGDDQLPSGHVELSVSSGQYQPGETIYFTIKNNFPTKIYITNNCPSEPLNVYRWSGTRWDQIHDTAPSAESECYTQPRRVLIEAGKTVTYSFKDWPNLLSKPGVYRLVLVIDHYDQLPFVDFKILEKPAEPQHIITTHNTSNEPESSSSNVTTVPTKTRAEPEPEHEPELYNDD